MFLAAVHVTLCYYCTCLGIKVLEHIISIQFSTNQCICNVYPSYIAVVVLCIFTVCFTRCFKVSSAKDTRPPLELTTN